MSHQYYSQRNGSNPNLDGLPLSDTIDLFLRVYNQLESEGYFTQAFGFWCIDNDHVEGLVKDVELEMLLSIRKKNLWPLSQYAQSYTEDDFLDVIEFLYQHVSKPIDGTMHSYGGCGMHWETFNKKDGQSVFIEKINTVLGHYKNKYELDACGQVLSKPEKGFEQIFKADVPSDDNNIVDRINAATTQFRRHGSTIDDRRQAVRDLADVLEYLKPKVKQLLSNKDEQDLFNIANNFGVRHHNDKQKTSYDSAIWLSWMFYFYLSTIHVVLRKIGHDSKPQT
ncbi:TPA: hypothetical protein ACGF6D_003487 [Vibrio cholerae]|uniref:hypothetical protein n=1 Tax=Vibrio cholerae TaxID=666 RepID=UPI000BA9326D|nr:hypothetical protein [Vibrio cholerae]EJL6474456.1 hypothetical protein [Vibrio cholerae]ELG4677964.1 hypothetical protein [Vibrio cholerae]ELW1717427.1 hypothetical protein [Vibrio cholerae]PAS27307.1 hypothetical protein CGT72_18290 [Vibrio cholerae]TQQ27407.1 hypothetical protein FLL67_14890 [Vibrio cholerae]